MSCAGRGARRAANFYHALLNIWLGDKPLDPALKRLLLGDAPPENVRSNNAH